MEYINTITLEYPVSLHALRQVYPQTVFPEGYSETFEEYAPVQPTEPPEHDPATHKVTLAQPDQVDGQWQQQWEVVPLTPEEIEAARRARVPQSCTRRQGRLALLAHGHLADVEAAIAAIADPAERMAAQIEYEAGIWERGNAFLQAMWAQLGGTPEQLDDLFSLAVTL